MINYQIRSLPDGECLMGEYGESSEKISTGGVRVAIRNRTKIEKVFQGGSNFPKEVVFLFYSQKILSIEYQ